MKHPSANLLATFILGATAATAVAEDRHLLLIAGRDSHGPAAHNHELGMKLFAAQLAASEGLKVSVAIQGWPEDDSLVDQADAIVIYSDGLQHHPALMEDRLARLNKRVTEDGIGIGMVHFAVHVPADNGSDEFKAWIGGHYHKGWDNDSMRRLVLNAMLWVSKIDIPEGGAPFTLTTEESDAQAANIDS